MAALGLRKPTALPRLALRGVKEKPKGNVQPPNPQPAGGTLDFSDPANSGHIPGA